MRRVVRTIRRVVPPNLRPSSGQGDTDLRAIDMELQAMEQHSHEAKAANQDHLAKTGVSKIVLVCANL